MTDTYRIEPSEKPEWDVIGGGIQEHNVKHGGAENYKGLNFVLRAEDGTVVGGLIGGTFWNWCHIDLLWIREDLRGKGYGHQLLIAAEEEAIKRGAKNAFLDTFTFQAPEFYKKHGYRVFGELPDFPAGYTRYYMTKEF